MQVRHLLSSAAIALAFCASGAFATDVGCRLVANGVEKCDVPTGAESTRDAIAAEVHAKADTSTGCRTVANGVQKCDLPTGRERSREDVVAEVLNGSSGYAIGGCRTVANGVQKCDMPNSYPHGDATAVAKSRSSTETH